MFFISRRIKLHIAIIALISIGAQLPIGGQTRRAPATLSPEAIAKRVMPSVVSIRMSDGSNFQSGSGFFVSPDTIATNFHVIEGMTSGTVRIVGGTRTYSISGVVGYDKETDLALIQISASIGKSLALASSEKPAVGATVYVVSNPQGLEGTFSPGTVSGLRDFSDGSLIQITAPISPGSSGGPVVNNKAEVVGIAVGAFEFGQALNFAIPVSSLKTLQSGKHSAVTVRHAGRNLAKPSEQIAKATPVIPPTPVIIPTPTPRATPTPISTTSPITKTEAPSPAAPQTTRIDEADQIFWNEISKRDTVADYEFYLRERPNGAFAAEAQRRVAEAKQRQKNARDEVERLAWEAAVKANTRDSYKSYLFQYEDSGRYSREAGERIVEFYKAEQRAEQEEFWKSTEDTQTAEAYSAYLRRYPRGIYASVARLKLSELGTTYKINGSRAGDTAWNSLGIEFSWIPPGKFLMGTSKAQAGRQLAQCRKEATEEVRGRPSTEDIEWLCGSRHYPNESPQRLVTIDKGFWMGRYEITVGQYKMIMDKSASSSPIREDEPVFWLSWEEAKEFIKRLNDRDDGFVYSLPSEAEWEYAARAGTTTAFSSGDSGKDVEGHTSGFVESLGFWKAGLFYPNFSSNWVGRYKPNHFGLFDMHGGVSEWVEDIWKSNYIGLPTDGRANTTLGDSTRRIFRGGYSGASVFEARSAKRSSGHFADIEGFRIVARRKFNPNQPVSFDEIEGDPPIKRNPPRKKR